MASTNTVVLDSLADLQAAFDNVVVGSDGGRWRTTSGGSTVSGNTGPGSNNVLGFVYTETSGTDSVEDIAARGIIDMQSDEIPDGTNRVLNLRVAVAGDYADGTEGLEILTRADDSGTWVQAGFIYGWAFSNTYEQGDTFDDENDVERTVAADGGWVDFEVSIPDTAGQIELRPHYIHGEGTQTWEHDIAFRSFSFDYDDTPASLTAPAFTDDTGDDQSWTQNIAITSITVPTASGNPAPTYAVQGNLPAGIAFNTSTRVISGTPTAAGSGTITIRATNSEGNADWTVDYATAAALAAPAFADDTGDAQTWTVNAGISQFTIPVASGNPAPTYAVVGSLPAGIAFNTATRAISGTPTATGSGTITIRATNSEGSDDWTVAYSILAFIPDYVLEVDWDNDGTYGNANADVWPRVIEGTFSCKRGRNFASQRTGRSVAGSLEVQLDNRDGLFDPDNTMSALSGLLSGGRRIRWQMNDGAGNLVTQWTGWLRTIEQRDRYTGFDRVRFRALGVISRLNPPREGQQQQAVVRGQETDIAVQDAAIKVFDPDGSIGSSDAVVEGVDYRASYIHGDREMARWWADRPRLTELRDLEQTEAGFLWEPKDGFIGLDAASNRQSASSRISQATFTDESPGAGEIPAVADGIKPDHPREDLANIITSQVRRYTTPSMVQVLWNVADLEIGAGADFAVIARYPNENTAGANVGVNAWTPLVAGTDYTAQTGVTLTMTTEGNEATIRVQNTGAATMMDIQVRGTTIVRAAPLEITTKDDDSVDEHGPVPYPFPTPWLSDPTDVFSLHRFLLRIYSQPAERLALTWEADSDRDKAADLDISDRVTITRRGMTDSFFIESIRHRVTADFHFIIYTLSPAGLYGEIFVLGVSKLGEGILAA